jgi:acyl-CoA synthetase (NDP forming)
MIQELKGYPVLRGMRGEPPADLDALVDIIQKVGQLAHEFPDITKLSIEPVFVFEKGKGAVIANARIYLR